LPGKLLCKLKQVYSNKSSSDTVLLTDYEDVILERLSDSIIKEFENDLKNMKSDDILSTDLNVNIFKLDWSWFDATSASFTIENDYELSNDASSSANFSPIFNNFRGQIIPDCSSQLFNNTNFPLEEAPNKLFLQESSAPPVGFNDVDILMGSALVYAPCHAAVADVIRYLLLY